MNKHLHKIIFNKKRGQMVAVAENTVRDGKSTQDSGTHSSGSLFNLGALLGSLLMFGYIGLSEAQVIADRQAPAHQRPVILKTPDNAPLINIQTPSERGLSHNRYTEFNIDGKGAVLNNNRASNPFLAKGTANLILNEIRSNNPSRLEGIIRVDGTKADVIVANPSGIMVNGGGFQNAGRGILTTGQPEIKNGALDYLNIRQGLVEIGNRGFNNHYVDYTDILSRLVNVQGRIQANNLLLATGAQKLDFESGDLLPQEGVGNKPTVGIDTSHLGGMYADSITLIANEQGAGVRNTGTLQGKKRLILTSSGQIENSGTIEATAKPSAEQPGGYIRLHSTDANADIVLNGGKIQNDGLLTLDSNRHITLNNATLNNHSGSIYLDAKQNLHANGQSHVKASGELQAYAGKDVQFNHVSIEANQDANILSSGNLSIENSKINSKTGNIHIEAAEPNQLGASDQVSVQLKNNQLNAAKNVAWLSDGNIIASNNTVAAENIYAHSDKNLSLEKIKTGQIQAQNINLNGDKHVSIQADQVHSVQLTPNKEQIVLLSQSSDTEQKKPIIHIIQDLEAKKDLTINGGSISIENTTLAAKAGDLHLSSKYNIDFKDYSVLSADNHINVSSLNGQITSSGLAATAAKGSVSILANDSVLLNSEKSTPFWINATQTGNLQTGTDGLKIQSDKGKVHIQYFDFDKGLNRYLSSVRSEQINIENNPLIKNKFRGNGIYLGSVGAGQLRTGAVDIHAGSGDVTLTAEIG